ncbi:MAG TPA: PRC-barrel domain-containing protein [Anaerolineales bacterium]|nr:PRC-barrel domain-containing protein [Anaerolineales bacterium]
MRKTHLLIVLGSIVSLLMLAACGSAENPEGTPVFTEPAMDLTMTPEGEFTEEPEATDVPEVTEPPTATEPGVETQPAVTEPATTLPATTSEVLPPTGFVDPSLVSNQLDYDVWNLEDEQIGTAEDMILNLEEKKIDYLIVEAGGFLGIGGKLVAVPYDRLQLADADATSESEPQNVWILDVSREELEGSAEFDREALPLLGEPAVDYDLEFRSHWEAVPAADTTGTPEAAATDAPSEMADGKLTGVVLASQVLDMNFVDANDGELASIEDIVVNPETGEIRYVVVQIGVDIADLNGRWVLIPVDAINLDATNEALVITVDDALATGIPSFAPNELPDTTQDDWDADIVDYWNALIR